MTLVRSLLDGNEQNFIRAFQDFLDNTPSFLHSGVQDPFFPAFFAGAFITAFDCGIANGERIFFRFDIDPNNGQQRSLKIAVLSNPENNQQRFVRCYTITGREDIPGSRFSEEEKASVQNLIGNNVQGLVWQERKVFLRRELVAYGSSRLRSHWQGFPDEDMFAVDAASPCPINGFNEIQWNGVLDERLADFPNLANDDALEVQDLIRVLLEYKVEMYNQYRQALNFGHNGKSYYHGFLLGFLMNFRYTNHQVRVYQELFMGEGYSDIALLVRGQNNITNSVPVIIELGIGGGANVALETARTRINRCPISSLSLHTTSQHAVCVGLNFNAEPSFITNVEPFLQEEQSLVEILSQTIPGAGNFEQDVAQNISNHLRFLSFGVPALQSQFLNEGNRRFNYIVNFISGGAIFAQQDIVAAGNQINIIKYLPQYQGDINDIVSSIVLNTHFEGENGAIVFHIRNVLDYNMLPGLCLQLDALQLQPQDRVCEVMCQLNPTIEVNDLPRVDDPNQVNLRVISVEAFNYGEYLQRYNNHFFPCNLLPVNDIGNLHNIAGRMMNDNWTNIVAYGELMQGISRVLFPLRFIINRNNAHGDGFHAVLHGTFHAFMRHDKVIIEFQVGGGSRIDLLLIRNPALVAQGLDNTIDTQPIAIEARFFTGVGDIRNAISGAKRQIEVYGSHCGYNRVSGGGQVALSYALFNNAEQQNPNALILHPTAMSVYPINHGIQ